MPAPTPPFDILLGSAAAEIIPMLADLPVETALFFYLDRQRGLVGIDAIPSAACHRIELPLRSCIGRALALDADGLLIAHNHPSGNPAPSSADIATTRALVLALRPIGMTLIDHLIITPGETYSFRAFGLL